ncbi:MAG: hypothetical protein CVU91_10890 [Firmicutes bacterium HGW-Firmicutes-16]|nr:MAG: hypothetical protein CVU91_10890 [Firmicutes bacterium HGW-Firmicutes-16]
MPRKDAPEFSYDEKTQLYRKRIKNEEGRWIPVYGKTKPELRAKVKAREAEVARLKEEIDNPPCYKYFAEWFALWSPGKGVKDVESIRNAVNNHILPVIGTMRMIDVTENDLIGVLNEVSDKSKSLNDKVVARSSLYLRPPEKRESHEMIPRQTLRPAEKKRKRKFR